MKWVAKQLFSAIATFTSHLSISAAPSSRDTLPTSYTTRRCTARSHVPGCPRVSRDSPWSGAGGGRVWSCRSAHTGVSPGGSWCCSTAGSRRIAPCSLQRRAFGALRSRDQQVGGWANERFSYGTESRRRNFSQQPRKSWPRTRSTFFEDKNPNLAFQFRKAPPRILMDLCISLLFGHVTWSDENYQSLHVHLCEASSSDILHFVCGILITPCLFSSWSLPTAVIKSRERRMEAAISFRIRYSLAETFVLTIRS